MRGRAGRAFPRRGLVDSPTRPAALAGPITTHRAAQLGGFQNGTGTSLRDHAWLSRHYLGCRATGFSGREAQFE